MKIKAFQLFFFNLLKWIKCLLWACLTVAAGCSFARNSHIDFCAVCQTLDRSDFRLKSNFRGEKLEKWFWQHVKALDNVIESSCSSKCAIVNQHLSSLRQNFKIFGLSYYFWRKIKIWQLATICSTPQNIKFVLIIN